nr:MAG TPA: hypothetical protein [Caudoviricetes sp.]
MNDLSATNPRGQGALQSRQSTKYDNSNDTDFQHRCSDHRKDATDAGH